MNTKFFRSTVQKTRMEIKLSQLPRMLIHRVWDQSSLPWEERVCRLLGLIRKKAGFLPILSKSLILRRPVTLSWLLLQWDWLRENLFSCLPVCQCCWCPYGNENGSPTFLANSCLKGVNFLQRQEENEENRYDQCFDSCRGCRIRPYGYRSQSPSGMPIPKVSHSDRSGPGGGEYRVLLIPWGSSSLKCKLRK